MGGPEMRGKLLGENCGIVDPVGLLELGGELELRERGHRGLELRGGESAEIAELSNDFAAFGGEFPIVNDELAEQQWQEGKREAAQEIELLRRELARFGRVLDEALGGELRGQHPRPPPPRACPK